MKKGNEKGFLLAEAIVVGVFVLSLFTFLFVNIIPLVGVYESYENYDNLDGAYNTNLIRAMIMEDDNVSTILSLGSSGYKVYDVNSLCSALSKTNYCKSLLGSSFLDVKYVYVTWYRTSSIKSASQLSANKSDFDRAIRDYIESMDGYTQPSGSTYSSYHRIIVYYNDGSFATSEIKIS